MKLALRVVVAVFFISIVLLTPIRAQRAPPLTPSDIRAAYDVNPLLQSGYTGKGVTVAIVGQHIDETFYSDLKAFNSKYGLPDAVISVAQPYDSGGASKTDEITADTEFVHAMAPDAKILLVLVGSHTILDGFSYVIDHNAADVATMSWYWYYQDNGDGSAAKITRSHNDEYAKSIEKKITLISTSGDAGSNNTITHETKSSVKALNVYMMPQYSQYVTIVGGTELTLQSGTYSETGWIHSGGGPSNLFPEPDWQTGLGVPQNQARNIPDIALDASCQTPYANYWNKSQGRFCGTSAAAPTFAGIMADIDQAAGGRVGFLNPLLYSIASTDPSVYHDVTSGCSLVQVESTTQTGYCAHPGWDFVTGWGSIDASKLAKHLAPKANIVPGPQTPNPQLSTSTIRLTTTAASTSMIILDLSVIALPFIGIIGLIVFVVRRRKGKRTGGAAAEVLASRPSPAPVPMTEGTKFCTACGVRIPVTARFCENCGSKQD